MADDDEYEYEEVWEEVEEEGEGSAVKHAEEGDDEPGVGDSEDEGDAEEGEVEYQYVDEDGNVVDGSDIDAGEFEYEEEEGEEEGVEYVEVEYDASDEDEDGSEAVEEVEYVEVEEGGDEVGAVHGEEEAGDMTDGEEEEEEVEEEEVEEVDEEAGEEEEEAGEEEDEDKGAGEEGADAEKGEKEAEEADESSSTPAVALDMFGRPIVAAPEVDASDLRGRGISAFMDVLATESSSSSALHPAAKRKAKRNRSRRALAAKLEPVPTVAEAPVRSALPGAVGVDDIIVLDDADGSGDKQPYSALPSAPAAAEEGAVRADDERPSAPPAAATAAARTHLMTGAFSEDAVVLGDGGGDDEDDTPIVAVAGVADELELGASAAEVDDTVDIIPKGEVELDDVEDGVKIPFQDGHLFVRVLFHELRTEKRKKFTVYYIVCRWKGPPVVSWTVERRYSEFDQLHEQLHRLFPVPRLPGKSLFRTFSESFIQRRQEELDAYIQGVLRSQGRRALELLPVANFLQIGHRIEVAKHFHDPTKFALPVAVGGDGSVGGKVAEPDVPAIPYLADEDVPPAGVAPPAYPGLGLGEEHAPPAPSSLAEPTRGSHEAEKVHSATEIVQMLHDIVNGYDGRTDPRRDEVLFQAIEGCRLQRPVLEAARAAGGGLGFLADEALGLLDRAMQSYESILLVWDMTHG